MTRKLLLAAIVALVAAGAARAGGFDGPAIAKPARVPDFALRDQHGRLIRLSAERGNVVLLTFLYTRCPDLCPLTAVHLDSAVQRLGAAATHVRVLAVSVDPYGDTPASVRRFVRTHRLHREFHYLTGPAATLHSVWVAYRILSTRHRGDRVDHTLYTMLIDPAGRDRVLYDSTARPAAIAHDLRLLLAAEG
jgi:protein SCO1/2